MNPREWRINENGMGGFFAFNVRTHATLHLTAGGFFDDAVRAFDGAIGPYHDSRPGPFPLESFTLEDPNVGVIVCERHNFIEVSASRLGVYVASVRVGRTYRWIQSEHQPVTTSKMIKRAWREHRRLKMEHAEGQR